MKHFSLYFADQAAAIDNSGERSLVVACGSRGPHSGLGADDVPESGDKTSENDQETVSETCHLGPNFGT